MVEIGTVRRESPVGGTGIVPLSEAVMRALIAVAEQPEDPFRPICIQTIAEIRKSIHSFPQMTGLTLCQVLIDIDLVSRTGGIGFLLHVLGEGPAELTPILATTFLHIVDSPRTRVYLRVGMDLEVRYLDFI